MNCPFCSIIQNSTEEVLRETEHAFIVLSNPRLVPGHLLVIPKRHVEKFSELPEAERAELLDEVIRLEESILDKFASGCDISQHFRPFIQQSKLKVNHLHVHVRPREFEDELYKEVQGREKEVFKDLDRADIAKFKKLLFG